MLQNTLALAGGQELHPRVRERDFVLKCLQACFSLLAYGKFLTIAHPILLLLIRVLIRSICICTIYEWLGKAITAQRGKRRTLGRTIYAGQRHATQRFFTRKRGRQFDWWRITPGLRSFIATSSHTLKWIWALCSRSVMEAIFHHRRPVCPGAVRQ